MAVKLTKNELKTQKDQLKQFERYLPTLQLKKQQLQLVIRQIYAELDEKTKERKRMIGNLDDWVAVFAENTLYRIVIPVLKIIGNQHARILFIALIHLFFGQHPQTRYAAVKIIGMCCPVTGNASACLCPACCP